MGYKVKEKSAGKVRLERGGVSIVLDKTTSQEALAEWWKTPAGKKHISKTNKATK